VTVPVEVDPPATEVGDRTSEVGTRMFETLFTNPENIICPQPVSVSQPTPGFEVSPFGKVPFEGPDVISLNTVGSPLNE
jgi:hypothetical protein